MKKCWHEQRSRNLVHMFRISLTLPRYFFLKFPVSSTKDFTYERGGCSSYCKPRKNPAWKGLRKQNQSKQILNNFQDLTRLQKKIFCVKLKSYDFVFLTLKDAMMFSLKFPLIINIVNLNVTCLELLTRSNRLLITHIIIENNQKEEVLETVVLLKTSTRKDITPNKKHKNAWKLDLKFFFCRTFERLICIRVTL